MAVTSTISLTSEDLAYLQEHGAAKTVRQALLLHRKIASLQPFGRQDPVSWIQKLKKNLQIFSERNLQLVDRVEVLEGMIKDGMVQQKPVRIRRVREVSEEIYSTGHTGKGITDYLRSPNNNAQKSAGLGEQEA